MDDRMDLPDGTSETDESVEDCHPAAGGILRCLEMLAEEATALDLPRTLDALHRAMAACAVEAVETTNGNRLMTAMQRPAGTTLH